MKHARKRSRLSIAAIAGVAALCAAAIVVIGVSNSPTVKVANSASSAASCAGTTTVGGIQLGSYNGGANVCGDQQFATETDTTASNYSDYLDGTSFSSMCSGTSPYPLGDIKGQLGNMQLILSVPLAGAKYGSTGQSTMASYAANPTAWDQCFTTLATDLVADGFSNAIIRLMWEPDSGIYSNDDLTSAANYATLWRDAWNSAMAVSGANFQWAWYWGGNFDTTTNNDAYPGSQYVNFITFDQYDQSWQGSPCSVPYNGSNFTAVQSQCVWTNNISQTLKGLTNFATMAGKPIGIGEWGVINRSDGHGGGDDPTYINNFTAWMKANGVVWASYFNFNSGGNSILSNYPNSLAAFQADLGGASPPPTTTTTTAPPVSTTSTTVAPTTTTTRPPATTTTTRPPATTTTTRPPATTTTTRPPSTTTTTAPATVKVTCTGSHAPGVTNYTLKCTASG